MVSDALRFESVSVSLDSSSADGVVLISCDVSHCLSNCRNHFLDEAAELWRRAATQKRHDVNCLWKLVTAIDTSGSNGWKGPLLKLPLSIHDLTMIQAPMIHVVVDVHM